MVILFIGPSGSGKDTQAAFLKELEFTMISTGDLMRERAKQSDELGVEIAGMLSRGEFIPTEITYSILQDHIADYNPMHMVLNGVVRDVEQIPLLDATLDRLQKKLDKVFYFNIDREIAFERLLKRKRADDNEVEIGNRLSWFFEKIGSILEEYEKRGILVEVDASKSIEEIRAIIRNQINI